MINTMREVLFRGKVSAYNDDSEFEYGEWVRGLITFVGKYNGIDAVKILTEDGDECWVDPETVGRFTGLTDKNGTKIFEGDIVNLFGMNGEIVCECGAFGIAFHKAINYRLLEKKVPFNNEPLFCYNDNFVSLWELWWNYEQDDNPLYEVEVIGNIHDNSDLLEKM